MKEGKGPMEGRDRKEGKLKATFMLTPSPTTRNWAKNDFVVKGEKTKNTFPFEFTF